MEYGVSIGVDILLNRASPLEPFWYRPLRITLLLPDLLDHVAPVHVPSGESVSVECEYYKHQKNRGQAESVGCPDRRYVCRSVGTGW